MAKRTITADEYKCNNPPCPTVVLAPKDDPPEGYGGRVIGITSGGGGSADWWACSAKCIEPAILAALDPRGGD